MQPDSQHRLAIAWKTAISWTCFHFVSLIDLVPHEEDEEEEEAADANYCVSIMHSLRRNVQASSYLFSSRKLPLLLLRWYQRSGRRRAARSRDDARATQHSVVGPPSSSSSAALLSRCFPLRFSLQPEELLCARVPFHPGRWRSRSPSSPSTTTTNRGPRSSCSCFSGR